MYQPKSIPYIESGLQRPIGMVPRLERINQPLGRKVYNLVGILLFSALIVSGVSESIELFSNIQKHYQTRPRTEIQESARQYLDYLQNN